MTFRIFIFILFVYFIRKLVEGDKKMALRFDVSKYSKYKHAIKICWSMNVVKKP